jgi:hypothetical protein
LFVLAAVKPQQYASRAVNGASSAREALPIVISSVFGDHSQEKEMTRGETIGLVFCVASILAFAIALFADSGQKNAVFVGVMCLVFAVVNLRKGRNARNSPPVA